VLVAALEVVVLLQSLGDDDEDESVPESAEDCDPKNSSVARLAKLFVQNIKVESNNASRSLSLDTSFA